MDRKAIAHSGSNPMASPAKYIFKATQPIRNRYRVGGGLAPSVLPHHRTYGSVYGGS